MKTVLVISNSAENTAYDLERSINTIKGYGMDPLVVMPAIFETDGSVENFDVEEMLDYVFDECEHSAVSIGYITDPGVYQYIASKVDAANKKPIVLRPSVISEAGAILVNEDTFYALQDEVLPLASFVVVNSLEAELFSGIECHSKQDLQRAAKQIYDTYGCHVMILRSEKTEGETLIFTGDSTSWLPHVPKRDPSKKSDISTAIACGLADENTLIHSARRAFEYVYGPIPVKRDPGAVAVPSIKRTAVPTMSGLSFNIGPTEPSDPSGNSGSKDHSGDPDDTGDPKDSVPPSSPAAPSLSVNVSVEDKMTYKDSAPAKPVATSSSLVSPAKSLREMAGRLSAERYVQSGDDHKGITSSIKDALDAKKSEVVDIAPPSVKFDRETGKTATDLQALKDRLRRLSGEG